MAYRMAHQKAQARKKPLIIKGLKKFVAERASPTVVSRVIA